MSGENLSIFVAFIAGVASFLSPCVLPLVPAYVGHLIGATANSGFETEKNHTVSSSLKRPGYRVVALTHAAMFVFGFSLVFVIFWASLGALSQLLPAYIRYVRPIGGIILIILGLNMAGLFRIAFLYRTFRPRSNKIISTKPKTVGLSASFFTGVIFAAGWTPCIGPVLGSIIGLASESSTALNGTFLLVAYSFGLGLPFMVCALALGQADRLLKRLNFRLNRRGWVSLVSGIFVALVGVLMLTNTFQTLPQYFNWMAL